MADNETPEERMTREDRYNEISGEVLEAARDVAHKHGLTYVESIASLVDASSMMIAESFYHGAWDKPRADVERMYQDYFADIVTRRIDAAMQDKTETMH